MEINHRVVETNGIEMHIAEQGEGPLVIMCHGFPELGYSWRHQLPALAEAGFRAIAPDQRGYGASDRPEAITDYDLHHLCGDMAGLLDALEIERAVFCGHDWGGFVVWAMPILYPEIHPDTAVLSIALGSMPFVIGAPLLAAAVAFIITTGDSYLLSCSTNVTHDFYVRFFDPGASQTKRLWLTRGVVLLLGVLAWVLGTFFPSVLAIQMYSYTMYGAAITPAVLAAFLWKRVTAAGGIASILLGGGGTLFWELVLQRPMGWNSILFSLPLSVGSLVLVSLATGRHRREADRPQPGGPPADPQPKE